MRQIPARSEGAGPGGKRPGGQTPSTSPAPEPITRFPGTGIGNAIQSAGGITVLILLALAAVASVGYVGMRRRKAGDL